MYAFFTMLEKTTTTIIKKYYFILTIRFQFPRLEFYWWFKQASPIGAKAEAGDMAHEGLLERFW